MSPRPNETEAALLDPEAWEVPSRLSDDDLYLQAGAGRRAACDSLDDREDDR